MTSRSVPAATSPDGPTVPDPAASTGLASRTYTPAVRRAAARLGVELAAVDGTGAGGRVTVGDVRQAAGLPAKPTPSTRLAPSHYPAAGLPAFTCSGMDPQRLAHVPPSVRAAVAAQPTLEQASALAAKYAGMSDDEARDALAANPDVPAHLGGCQGNWPG